MRQILVFRRNFARKKGETDKHTINLEARIPLDNHAFIIDQLKRPEEISMLAKTFGKRFIQVSVVTPVDKRKQTLIARLSSDKPGWKTAACKAHTDKLIDMNGNMSMDSRFQKYFTAVTCFLTARRKKLLKNPASGLLMRF